MIWYNGEKSVAEMFSHGDSKYKTPFLTTLKTTRKDLKTNLHKCILALNLPTQVYLIANFETVGYNLIDIFNSGLTVFFYVYFFETGDVSGLSVQIAPKNTRQIINLRHGEEFRFDK